LELIFLLSDSVQESNTIDLKKKKRQEIEKRGAYIVD
jgi:hypothetical protein